MSHSVTCQSKISQGPEIIRTNGDQNTPFVRSNIQKAGASCPSQDNPGKEFGDTYVPAANGGGQAESPSADHRRRNVEACPLSPTARDGGNIRIAQPDLPSDDPVITRQMRQARTQPRVPAGNSFAPRPKRTYPEIISADKAPIIKEILALQESRDPLAFERYLKTLSFHDLCARRDQLKDEAQLTTDNGPLTK